MEKMKEKKVNNLQLVEIDHQKFAVEPLNGNVNVNLTQMAKPFGRSKQPVQWLKTDASKNYMEVLSVLKNCSTADLLTVKQGGRNQGTWCTDYRIAMRFAQWLDPRFAMMVDEMLVNLLRGDAVLAKPFEGVEPVIHQGKAWYNYLDVLQALGYSRRSGSVAVRKRQFGQHFAKLFGRNFITLHFCGFLKRRHDWRQLEINFKNDNLALGGL